MSFRIFCLVAIGVLFLCTGCEDSLFYTAPLEDGGIVGTWVLCEVPHDAKFQNLRDARIIFSADWTARFVNFPLCNFNDVSIVNDTAHWNLRDVSYQGKRNRWQIEVSLKKANYNGFLFEVIHPDGDVRLLEVYDNDTLDGFVFCKANSSDARLAPVPSNFATYNAWTVYPPLAFAGIILPVAYGIWYLYMRHKRIMPPTRIAYFFLFGIAGGWCLAFAFVPSPAWIACAGLLCTLAPLFCLIFAILLQRRSGRTFIDNVAMVGCYAYAGIIGVAYIIFQGMSFYYEISRYLGKIP